MGGYLVHLPETAQPAFASGRLRLVQRSDGALPPAGSADHSFLGGTTHMARLTFGKSRVRESRMRGFVRAKPNGLSTRPSMPNVDVVKVVMGDRAAARDLGQQVLACRQVDDLTPSSGLTALLAKRGANLICEFRDSL
jgi:hypothetical protein